MPKTLIGWREWIIFPNWQYSGLKAKIDTGAKTSAIHARNLVFFKNKNRDWVRFEISPQVYNLKATKGDLVLNMESEIIDMRKIKSSTGTTTIRPIILATIQLGLVEKKIEISLIDRGKMEYKFLLGRDAMQDDFIIAPNRSYLLGKKINQPIKKH